MMLMMLAFGNLFKAAEPPNDAHDARFGGPLLRNQRAIPDGSPIGVTDCLAGKGMGRGWK